MTTRTTYRVTATREGDWWALEAPEVPGVFSQTRRLDQAEDAVRDAIALLLDVSPDEIEVEVEPELEGEVGEVLAGARAARAQLAAAQEDARSRTLAAAQTFAEQGMTVRDIGRLLSVSHQQAAKLLHGAQGSPDEPARR